MLVRELIDILSDHPGDLEVELAVVAPVDEDSDDITVDRYPVDGVLPWEDDDADLSAEESRVIWLSAATTTTSRRSSTPSKNPMPESPRSSGRPLPPRRPHRARRRRRQRHRRGGRLGSRDVRRDGRVRRLPPRRRDGTAEHQRDRAATARLGRPTLDLLDPAAPAAVLGPSGAPDILVTTPSVNVRKRIVDYTDDDLDRVVDLNIKGVFRLCRTFGAAMAEAGRGSMIGFSSIRSQTTEPGQGAYAATKAATVMLFKTLAAELGPAGVRANVIAPGVVETPLTQPIRDDPAWYQAYADKPILRRWAHARRAGRRRGLPRLGRLDATSPARRCSSTAAGPPPTAATTPPSDDPSVSGHPSV